jgi:low affinity Fe/Cu permease
MVISLSIVSFLTILLFQGYRTLADISLRVEHQKNLTTESVFFLQNLQQLVDNSTVDYSRYDLDQLKQQH